MPIIKSTAMLQTNRASTGAADFDGQFLSIGKRWTRLAWQNYTT